MSRLPKNLNFYIRHNEIEKRQTLKWFEENKDLLYKHAVFKHKYKGYKKEDIIKTLTEADMPILKVLNDEIHKYRRKKVQIDGPILGTQRINSTRPDHLYSIAPKIEVDLKDDPCIPPVDATNMRPLDPEEIATLYADEPHCRQRFLKLRYKKPPEKKYYSYETSNCVYGWRQSDSILVQKGAGGNAHKVDLAKQVDSAIADPPYYFQPTDAEHKICIA